MPESNREEINTVTQHQGQVPCDILYRSMYRCLQWTSVQKYYALGCSKNEKASKSHIDCLIVCDKRSSPGINVHHASFATVNSVSDYELHL